MKEPLKENLKFVFTFSKSLLNVCPEHNLKSDLILNCSHTREILHTLNYINDAIPVLARNQTNTSKD